MGTNPSGSNKKRRRRAAPQSETGVRAAVHELELTRSECEELRRQLQETQEVLDAIRRGEVDAVVVRGAPGARVYTLEGADRPYRLFVEEMQQGAVTLSPAGIIVYCNQCFAGIMGRPKGPLVGQPFREMVMPASRKVYDALLAQAVKERAAGEVELLVTPGDRPVPASLAINLFPAEDAPGYCVVVQDLTHQRHHEKLVAAEKRIREILGSITDCYFAMDQDWRFVEVNARAAEYFGMSAHQLVGKVKWELFPRAVGGEDDRQFRKAMAEQTPVHFEAHSHIRDGWCEVHAHPNPCGLTVYFRDITARKQAEEALQEADRRKDEFIAVLGHELRNPLAPIANAVDLLRSSGLANEMQQRAHDMIDRQLTHLVRLVDDLLDVSRISRGKITLRKEVFDMVAVVGAAAEDHRPLLESNGLRLDVALPHTPLCIEGDPTRITQIVGNLLINAGKFTPVGGRVSVELKAEGGGQACITISDTGLGFAPELLSSVFQPFHQGARNLGVLHSGLGLGLALVKALTELHGGTVRVNSSGLGKGAQFVVTLPMQPQPASPRRSATVPKAAASPRRVLVIEDNRPAADGLRMLLEADGHTVVVAHAGREGIAKAKEFKPELVISDIGLAGGMDGRAVARALRRDSRVAKAYMVAYSGFGQAQDKRENRAAGFDEHLTKPIRITDLRRLVAQLPPPG